MANSSEVKANIAAFTKANEEITSVIKTLQQSMTVYFESSMKLRGVWQGDGSNNIRAMAKSMHSHMEILLSNLSAYPKALNDVAGIYSQTETQVSETGKSLSFDANSMK